MPASAAAPIFAPCPSGWTLTSTGPDGSCEPPRELSCSGGEAQFLGDLGCHPVGDPCPAGEWSDRLPSGAPILYVRASRGGSGGSGTQADPYLSLAAAISAAPKGAVIALGKGTFTEAANLHQDVSLIGACAASSTIALPLVNGVSLGIINVFGGAATVRNLSLSAGPGGVYVFPSATADLEGLILENSTRGFTVDTSTVRARDIEIRGPHELGILVWRGTATLERLNVDGSVGYASISVPAPGGSLSMTDVVLRDGVETGGHASSGLAIVGGSTARGARVLIERIAGNGITTSGGTVHLDSAIFRDSIDPTDGTSPAAASAAMSASISLSRTKIERTQGTGIYVDGTSFVSMTDGLIQDIQLDLQGRGGYGILTAGAATLRRVRTLRPIAGGVLVANGALWFEDLSTNGAGAGINDMVFGLEIVGGSAIGRRIGIRAEPAGFALNISLSSTATISDLVIDSYSSGILVRASHLMLERALMTDSHGEGITADGVGSRLDVSDLIVNGTVGHALAINSAAAFRLERALLENDGGAGLFMIDSPFTALDVVSRGARSLASNEPGSSLRMTRATTGVVTRFVFENNAAFGLELLAGAQVDLHQGLVRGNRVGALVTSSDYDLKRLLDGVVFENTGSSFTAQ
jgi:hypothetical protein